MQDTCIICAMCVWCMLLFVGLFSFMNCMFVSVCVSLWIVCEGEEIGLNGVGFRMGFKCIQNELKSIQIRREIVLKTEGTRLTFN